MNKKVRFGIAGIGNMGSAHAKNIYSNQVENAELCAVCDIDECKIKWAEETFEQIQVFRDYHDMLDNAGIDAVIIATPHYFHPEIAVYAFEKGIHVLTEKPAGVYTEQVERMNTAAEKSGKIFGIMYNQRTNPIYAKAREMMQNGEIGELKRVVWIITNWYRRQSYYDSGTWRATWVGEGGGVMMNQCVHNVDLLQWIVGMPKTVTAHCDCGKYHNIEVEDDVTAFLQYENGATGVFITSTGENPGTNRLEISGTKAKVVIENGKLSVWSYDVSEREYCFMPEQAYKQLERKYSEFEQEQETQAHVAILRNFTKSILNGETLIAPGYDGIRALNIINGVYLSDWTKKTVTLPVDKTLFKELLMKKAEHSALRETVIQDETVDAGASLSRWQVNW